jgi:hypothetical protein
MGNVYARALVRAAEIVGGVEALAGRLGVPMYDLMQWMQGCVRPPLPVFLHAVDVVAQREIEDLTRKLPPH